MLARYEILKKTLKTNLYKTICEENEEYWRHIFYLLVKDESLYPDSYFSNNQSRSIINPRSALIIFGFAGWEEGKQDPLDLISMKSYLNSLSPGHRSLREHLSKYPKSIQDNFNSQSF